MIKNKEYHRNYQKRWRERNRKRLRIKNRKWQKENNEKKRNLDRGYYQKNKEKVLQKQKEYRKRNPHKIKARNKVNWLFRKQGVTNLKCSVCGSGENISKHHEDYSKPLDVIILCQACHNRRHFLK